MTKSPNQQNTSELKVTVYWGDILYDTAVFGPNEKVTIGKKPGATYVLDTRHEGMPGVSGIKDEIKLVEVHAGEKADFYFDDQIGGHIKKGEELLSLGAAKGKTWVTKTTDGMYQCQLTTGDKADAVIGHLSFYFQWINEREILPKSTVFKDKKTALIALALVLAALLFMVIVSLIQIEEPEKEKPQRVVMVLPKNAPAEAAVGQKQTDDGGAQKGEQGKADLAPKVEVKKETAADVLKKSNLGNVLSSLTSKTTETAPVAAGTKTGAAASFEQTGTGGFSTKGLKTGGGGKSVGIGRSVGEGVGGFEGTGHLGLSGNTVGAQGTGHGGPETKVAGGLDSDVIESVIKRRLDRVRLCYERQLNFNPQLSGKITVHFVIDGAGQVLSSRAVEDTMKNDAVKSCILAEVKTWTFPKPEGGTLVNVDYPFVFESSARGE